MPHNPQEALLAKRLGINYFFEKDYEAAQKHFETALSFEPRSREVFQYIIRCIQENKDLNDEDKGDLIHQKYQARLQEYKTPELYAEYLRFVADVPFYDGKNILTRKIEEALDAFPLAAEIYAETSKIYYQLTLHYDKKYGDAADDYMIKAIRVKYTDIDFLIGNFGSRLLKPVQSLLPLELALYENRYRNADNLEFCEKALAHCMSHNLEDELAINILKGHLKKLDPNNYLLKTNEDDIEEPETEEQPPPTPAVPLALVESKEKKPAFKKMTAKEIKLALDEYVIGQDDAKVIVSIAGENHYDRVIEGLDVQKSNLLLIGKSGVGKTHICESLAKILDVPFVIYDCTNLSDTGYVGGSFNDVFSRLYSKAEKSKDLAEKGIIALDELDKLATPHSEWKDVSGIGVQEEMLKPIEGCEVTFELPSEQGNGKGVSVTMNTRNILFIGVGAFARSGGNPSLEDIMTNTKTSSDIGFHTGKQEEVKLGQELLAEHLIQYGLHEQLAKRFIDYALLQDFSIDELTRILTEPKDAIIKQNIKDFKHKGVELDFTTGGLKEIARYAKKFDSGARALRRVCNKVLRELKFNISTIDKQQIIDAAFVRSKFK